jgi:magnesium-transporting ATPase (P-type)
MALENKAQPLWHALSAAEVLRTLKSDEHGLDDTEARARLRRVGPNTLPKPRRSGPGLIYLRQFKSPLIYLLLAAAVVSVAIGEATDALFIFAVLQINAVIGTVQEWKAETSARGLDALIHIRVMVRRGGDRQQIDSTGLVPGDIVHLESGSLVPADIRLLGAHALRADESLLTGESVPMGKDATLVLDDATAVSDRRNVLHAGTTISTGRATGVVTATGLATEIGRIAGVLAGAEAAPAPLAIRLERFTHFVGIVVVAAVAALAVAQLLQGVEATQIFFVAVALAVSAIPEGLPVAITVALSVGMARMARRSVIVRALPAAEGLGASTLIASDKTGTLTCNELTIKRLCLPGMGDLDVTGQGYVPEGAIRRPDGSPESLDPAAAAAAHRLAVAGVLCNEAVLRLTKTGYRHFGDTVDVAFLALAGKLGIGWDIVVERNPQVSAVPYEPAQRFAASVNNIDSRPMASVKGAAEVVAPMCRDVDQGALLAEAARLAGEGFRVLAVASGPVDEASAQATGEFRDLRFLGLVGLIDPVRPEVPEAIDRCRASGITVAMITGDHPATAMAISRQLGIAGPGDAVLTGTDLAHLAGDPSVLDRALAGVRVFARVEPLQKLSIVESFRRQGHFVTVTGDGVNDAPALNAANIGVAMGRGGTDVARGAADLILTDDNFASIVNGIEEGRIAYDNVRKVVYLLISTGAAEIVLFFLALIAGLPLPLFAVQLLWLNLVTNGIQDVALAFEKGEPGTLEAPPRPPDQPIFNRPMIAQTAVSGAFIGFTAFLFFRWALDAGWTEFEARNALLLLMVLFENVHVFNCRSEIRSAFRVPLAANPLLVLAVIAAQAVHIGAMYLPGLSHVLRLEPIGFGLWWKIALLALALIVVMECYKLLIARGSGRSLRARKA